MPHALPPSTHTTYTTHTQLKSPAVPEIIEAAWILPIEPANTILEAHSLVIQGSRILDILPHAVARARYPNATITLRHTHLLMPGLVNLHCHAAMSLLRGVGDDLPLHTWLQQRIWPLEGQFMSDTFVYDGTRIACEEMLRGGITCVSDMYFYPDASIRAARACGMRIAAGLTVIDFPTPYAKHTDEYFQHGLAAREEWLDEPLVSFTLAPHAPYTISDETFLRVRALSDELGLPIHTHIHETQQEVRDSLQQFGLRPLARLEKLGLLSPQFIGVHAVHLDENDLASLARAGAHLAHCPSSNLKLASGLPHITAWQTAGLNFGLGTDGAASNNRLDLWSEIRLAALLGKAVSGQANLASAHSILQAATLGGAKALGLDQDIGSLLPNKQADLIAIDFAAPALQPCYDRIGHLAYVVERQHVSDAWVAGQRVVNEQQIIHNSGGEPSFNTQKISLQWQYRVQEALSNQITPK